MDIRIKTIALHNFKGVRDASFTFDGKNARIEGENGAGKSTIFDAFVWLLFGKDHAGQDWTNFDLKPIDPQTREVIHGLEHWVEAELSVDGVNTNIRRVVAENWVKPRGQAEKVLQGHTQTFFINGVDTGTLKAYEGAIHQWIDERVFKLITNPLYFIDDRYTKWQDRRKAIVALVGNTDRAALDAEFADLVAEMRGEPMEIFRKRIAAGRRENRKDLDAATARVEAYKKTLPEAQDTAAATAGLDALVSECGEKISAVKAEISALDEKISSATDAAASKRAAVDAKNREILAFQIKMGDFLAEAVKAARNKENERTARIDKARAELQRIERTIANDRELNDRDKQTLDDYALRRGEDALRLKELGQRYAAEQNRAFEFNGESVCPACGRPFPEDRLEQEKAAAMERFTAERRAAMNRMVSEAETIKEDIRKVDGWIKARADAVAQRDSQIDTMAVAADAAREALMEAEGAPAVDVAGIEAEARRSPEFLQMVETERKMRSVLESMAVADDSVKDLLAERRKLEADIRILQDEYARKMQPMRDLLAVAAERKRIEGMIAQEQEAERRFADEVARLERLEARAAEYVKAEIDTMDASISRLFRVARWKMFSTTLDGGLQDMCEVTSPDGVPYRSMNDAQKILCGLDVIRVFSEHYDCTAPIFIDNAESITRREFDTTAQVIRLVVTPGAELRMVQEGPEA